MDLFALLILVVVLLFGAVYVSWVSWAAAREILFSKKGVGSNESFTLASCFVQHGLTLCCGVLFVSFGTSICLSIVRGEACSEAVKQLRALTACEESLTSLTWGSEGNQGTLHASPSSGYEVVTGASLTYIDFDNRDLEELVGQHPHITWFILSGTQIDDHAVRFLAQREDLTAVVLTDTTVTDRGVAALEGHCQIRELDLTRTAISNRCLEAVSSLPSLEYLNLRETDVTDDGVELLAGKTRLRNLDIQGTRVTDAAVPVLATLENLESLNLKDTALSCEAIAELRRVLKGCTITPKSS